MRLLVCVMVLGAAVSALANPAATLDQYSPYVNAWFNADTTWLNWQQEVVVGLAGALVQVDMYALSAGTCTFYLNAGAPWQTDPPDFTTTLVSSGEGWIPIDTSSANLSFQPGDHFVIGIIGGGTGLGLGGSYQPPLGGYPPGELYLNGSIHGGGGWDLAFKTYVPEPGCLALCLLAIAARRR